MLNRGLDAYALRQKTIATNIANVNTSDYKPQNVKFEEYFKEASSSNASSNNNNSINSDFENGSEEKGFSDIPRPSVHFSGDAQVNIDKEMSELAQNQIKYRYAAKAVKSYFAGIQTAISGLR